MRLTAEHSVLTSVPKLSWVLVLAAFCVACGGGAIVTPQVPGGGSPDTTLGVGDSFDVRVYGEEELSGKYQVAGDGMIDFPFIGRVEVEAREPTVVASTIQARLKEGGFLTNPQVSVLVTDYSSKHVSVMGAVAKPGVFPLANGLTIVHAVSLAGGLTPIASGNDVIVSRRTQGQIQRFRIAVSDVTEGRAEDFPLQAGDIIFVPQRIF